MTSTPDWTAWLRFSLAAQFVVASSVVSADEQAPPAMLSAREIRSGIAEAQSRITAFRITYEIEYPAGQGWPAGTYLRRTVGAMSPHFFFHQTAKGHSAIPWQDDRGLRRCYVVGDHAIDEWVNSRSYSYTSLTPEEPIPGSMPDEFLIHATGMWPLDGRPAPRHEGLPIALRDIADSDDYNTVRPRQEKHDGHWCHVLESADRDRLWIDTQRGFSLLVRETRDSESGHLFVRIELGAHRELKPGVWLPTWIRNIQFDYFAKTAEGRQRRVVDTQLNLLEIDLNEDVGAEIFQYVPPAGALWLNPPGEAPIQTSASGEEHLDHVVDWATKYRPPVDLQPTVAAKLLPFGYALAALLILEIVLQRLRWRATHQPIR